MNFYPGRKNMFLKIKNKFRFVSISLLLASLVTVSSASAEDAIPPAAMDFSFTVQDCTANAATWSPQLLNDGESVYPGSENNQITASTGFANGTPCGANSMEVDGSVASTLVITGGEMWTLSSDCVLGSCTASEDLVSVSGYYDVPSDAVGVYSGRLTLTWTPSP
jgi:hypothetical protein